MTMHSKKRCAKFAFIVAVVLCFAPCQVRAAVGGSGQVEITRDNADQILAFANKSQKILAGDYYTLPDVLQAYSQIYGQIWQLAKMPPLPKQKPDLKPDKGIFSLTEERALDRALKGMDRELEKIRNAYADLEKYVLDETIQDDGKKGEQLCKLIGTSHAGFVKARKDWRSLVEARAIEAEDYLLAEHPLKRQVLAARQIFEQMNEALELLRMQDTRRTDLEPFETALGELAIQAAKPPFPAAPALERLYRGFIREVEHFDKVMAAGLNEGFHAQIKRELAKIMERSRNAYNAFAREASNSQAL